MPSRPRHAFARLRAEAAGQPRRHGRPPTWPAVAGVVVVLLALTGVVLASGFSPPSPAAAGPAGQHGAGAAAGRPAGAPVGRSDQGRADVIRAHRSPGEHPGVPQSSCRSVTHIGDSTTVDLISPSVLPDPAQRLAARYAGVGVTSLHVNASGGRSIVEELPGQVNGYDTAQFYRNEGFRGCWVFALGTNDAANVAAGSTVGLTARIERMMSVAHGEPVMWVNTRTEVHTSAWAESNEQAWDNALVAALAHYPNMRIFNWATVAQPSWFLPDGIHYTPAGCAARAAAIAGALARAFPLHGHSAGRIVG